MLMIRSIVYLIAFLVWTLFVAVFALPSLITRDGALWSTRLWVRGMAFLARYLAGIRFEVRGRENIPDGPCIVAAQHQAAFETYMLFLLFDYPVFILKDSLKMIPLVGWYIWRGGLIAINRGAGASAMRRVLRSANEAIAKGETLLIFPEGTRTPKGQRQEYKPGIVALYHHCDAPLIPMALNSGYFWGKTRLKKTPGTIVFEFLPPIPPGLDRQSFLDTLRTTIESAAAGLPGPDPGPDEETSTDDSTAPGASP